MVVSKIQEQILAYKKWLKGLREHPNMWWLESVAIFQEHWNTDTADPEAMFDSCFHNSFTRRLWQTENWRPKEMMILFWKFDPVMVRAIFDDLFNETKEVDHRITRFVFGMDTLLDDYRRANPTSIENNHYHADYRMIALYLGFRYPDTYAAPYDFNLFVGALQQLGAREMPHADDLPRFLKVHRTLMTFLDKDPEVANLFRKHLHPRRHFQGKSMMLAVDFSRFVGASL